MNFLNEHLSHRKHVVAGFGNALLDITSVIKSNELINKFNLVPDTQSEVNERKIHEILESLERSNHEVKKNPGGCVQNSLRIIQTIVKQPRFSVFFGGLGCDNDGTFLESEVKKCGVETRYAKHSTLSTGKVAALIHGDKRTLIAHLGAAEVYRLEDFKNSENLQLLEEEVLIVYIEGFFITHSVDVALEVIKICRSNGVIVAFNISGAYVAEFYAEQLLEVVSLADIIIGNNDELKALGKAIGLKTSSLLDLALESHSFLYKKDNSILKYKLNHVKDFMKILLVTQGKDPVFCVYGSGQVVDFPVPPLDVSLIKDTTGAGDSFAAAFLLSFIQGKPIVECLAYGCKIAQKVIQQIGVILPSEQEN